MMNRIFWVVSNQILKFPFLRVVGQNKIQIRTIFEPSNESTTTPSTLYIGKRPTGFETEPDDQMTLIRQWLLHKREKDCKKVEPDKQSVTPPPRLEEKFLTQYAKNPYLQCDKSINTMEELELTHLNDDGTEKFMSDKVILQQLEPFLQDQLYNDYQSSVRG